VIATLCDIARIVPKAIAVAVPEIEAALIAPRKLLNVVCELDTNAGSHVLLDAVERPDDGGPGQYVRGWPPR
jgi:hypothetical protein